LGWHVEGFVLLRIAYRYGSTRLARLHWSGTENYVFSGPIDLKLASQPHILKGTCTKPQSHHAECNTLHVCVSVNLAILSITFVWLLCARRESPLDGQMRFSRSSPHWYMVAADAACIPM